MNQTTTPLQHSILRFKKFLIHNFFLVVILAVIIILVLLAIGLGSLPGQKAGRILLPSPGESATFVAESAKTTFPRFTQIDFTPYSVKNGDTQEIKVTLLDPTEIKELKGTIKKDEGVEEITFEKLAQEGERHLWIGSWRVDDLGQESYYPLTLHAFSDSGNSEQTTIFFRLRE